MFTFKKKNNVYFLKRKIMFTFEKKNNVYF